MSYHSPLSRARGLGSANEGVEHWWMQRVTAVALIPLVVWLVFALAGLAGGDYGAIRAWLAHPAVAVALICLVLALFYHSALGTKVVIEDYVATHWLRFALITGGHFFNAVLAVVSILAILKIVLGGAWV